MQIKYTKIGIYGLSCRLCPMYITKAESKCLGCKSPNRIAVDCPFITCAVKKEELNFVGIVKKIKPMKNGRNTEKQVKRMILSNVIKNLRKIFYLFKRKE